MMAEVHFAEVFFSHTLIKTNLETLQLEKPLTELTKCFWKIQQATLFAKEYGRSEINCSQQTNCSLSYFKSILHCDVDSAKRALRRARQLYSDIEQVKVFDKFTYYYLKSWRPEDPAANIEMKKNYIRVRLEKTIELDITGKHVLNGSLTSSLKEQSARGRYVTGESNNARAFERSGRTWRGRI